MNQRITMWIGNDDGDPDGMSGYGYDVGTEDCMVSISVTDTAVHAETTHEFFIMRDLFPKIRAAMDRIDTRFEVDR